MATYVNVNLIHVFITRLDPVWRAIIESHAITMNIGFVVRHENFYSRSGLMLNNMH